MGIPVLVMGESGSGKTYSAGIIHRIEHIFNKHLQAGGHLLHRPHREVHTTQERTAAYTTYHTRTDNIQT